MQALSAIFKIAAKNGFGHLSLRVRRLSGKMLKTVMAMETKPMSKEDAAQDLLRGVGAREELAL